MGLYLLVTAVKMLLKIDIVSTTKKLSDPVNHKQKTNEVLQNLWKICEHLARTVKGALFFQQPSLSVSQGKGRGSNVWY